MTQSPQNYIGCYTNLLNNNGLALGKSLTVSSIASCISNCQLIQQQQQLSSGVPGSQENDNDSTTTATANQVMLAAITSSNYPGSTDASCFCWSDTVAALNQQLQQQTMQTSCVPCLDGMCGSQLSRTFAVYLAPPTNSPINQPVAAAASNAIGPPFGPPFGFPGAAAGVGAGGGVLPNFPFGAGAIPGPPIVAPIAGQIMGDIVNPIVSDVNNAVFGDASATVRVSAGPSGVAGTSTINGVPSTSSGPGSVASATVSVNDASTSLNSLSNIPSAVSASLPTSASTAAGTGGGGGTLISSPTSTDTTLQTVTVAPPPTKGVNTSVISTKSSTTASPASFSSWIMGQTNSTSTAAADITTTASVHLSPVLLIAIITGASLVALILLVFMPAMFFCYRTQRAKRHHRLSDDDTPPSPTDPTIAFSQAPSHTSSISNSNKRFSAFSSSGAAAKSPTTQPLMRGPFSPGISTPTIGPPPLNSPFTNSMYFSTPPLATTPSVTSPTPQATLTNAQKLRDLFFTPSLPPNTPSPTTPLSPWNHQTQIQSQTQTQKQPPNPLTQQPISPQISRDFINLHIQTLNKMQTTIPAPSIASFSIAETGSKREKSFTSTNTAGTQGSSGRESVDTIVPANATGGLRPPRYHPPSPPDVGLLRADTVSSQLEPVGGDG